MCSAAEEVTATLWSSKLSSKYRGVCAKGSGFPFLSAGAFRASRAPRLSVSPPPPPSCSATSSVNALLFALSAGSVRKLALERDESQRQIRGNAHSRRSISSILILQNFLSAMFVSPSLGRDDIGENGVSRRGGSQQP